VNPNPAPAAHAAKTLHRSDDRIIGGVCSGIAEYSGLDTTLVRIIAALLVVFGGGGLVIYLVAWVVMPDSKGTVIARRTATTPTSPTSPTSPTTPAE
jgi:phage shock protein PspC (stress-responsive transcriptional regulator)